MKTPKRLLTGTAVVLALGVLGVAAAMALSGGASSSSATTVKTRHALGKKILVTPKGRTLYSLSAETHGRFICTSSSCLALWKPLVVPRGTKPTGAHHLGTIRRPGGKTQVTYQGKPLYTFVQDHKPGDAQGEGFKDVGTWHAASVGSTSTPAPMTTTSPGFGY